MIHPGVNLICYMEYGSFGCYFYFSFHLILVTPNDFAKFKLFVPISSVLHLERKKKKYLWIYLDL